MKKKILSLAVIAMSMFSINAVAQNPTTNNAPAKECKKECKASQCNDQKCDKQCPTLFSGMNLTADQQAQLKALQEKRVTKMRQRAESAKAQKKSDRRQNDSLRMADRKNYLEEVKAIVGPDQYVIFLENIVLNNPQGKGHSVMPGKMGRHGDKAMRHGDRMKKDGRHQHRGDGQRPQQAPTNK